MQNNNQNQKHYLNKDNNELQDIDKKLLDVIQKKFPIKERPYKIIGETLNLSENEVINKIKELKTRNIIRNISAVLEPSKIGYKTTLVCAKVKKDKIEEVAFEINKNTAVSHNYERNNNYNLWFTLSIPSDQSFEKIIEGYKKLLEIDEIFMLPSVKMYKIAVRFDLGTNYKIGESQQVGNNKYMNSYNVDAEIQSQNQNAISIDQKINLEKIDKLVLKELQNDLSTIESPFNIFAKKINLKVDDFFEIAERNLRRGTIRRYAATLRHRAVGFKTNAMVVWEINSNLIDSIAKEFCEFNEVSHCYQRISTTNWPYSLYTMIHTRTEDECQKLINKMSQIASIPNNDYEVLYSTREFKKERVIYFQEIKN